MAELAGEYGHYSFIRKALHAVVRANLFRYLLAVPAGKRVSSGDRQFLELRFCGRFRRNVFSQREASSARTIHAQHHLNPNDSKSYRRAGILSARHGMASVRHCPRRPSKAEVSNRRCRADEEPLERKQRCYLTRDVEELRREY